MFEYIDSDSFEVEEKASYLGNDLSEMMWAIDMLRDEAEGTDMAELASALEEMNEMAQRMLDKLKRVL